MTAALAALFSFTALARVLATVVLVVTIPASLHRPPRAPAEAQIAISGSAPAIACNLSASIDTASSGNVEVVALTASQTIYICSYQMVADGVVAVQWIYGTGTACATGETNLSGPMAFVANSGISAGSGYGVLLQTAVSNALCIELSAAVGIRGSVSYAKF